MLQELLPTTANSIDVDVTYIISFTSQNTHPSE